MNPVVSAIIAAMIRLAAFSFDHETREERIAFLTPTAEAIAHAARNREEIAALIAQAYAETKFARAVLEGRCLDMPKGMQCDLDKHGVPRARGPWQNWEAGCRTAWRFTDGSPEAIGAAAKCTISSMRLAKARCSSWDGAFAAMRGQYACTWVGTAPRMQLMRDVLAHWGEPMAKVKDAPSVKAPASGRATPETS